MFRLVVKLFKVLADGRISQKEFMEMIQLLFPKWQENPVFNMVIKMVEFLEDGKLTSEEIETIFEAFTNAEENNPPLSS